MRFSRVLLGKRWWRRLRVTRRLRARSRLRRANARSVTRARARTQAAAQPRSAVPHDLETVYGTPRTLLFVTVKRDNTSWRSLYGHWWVEIDDDRSYGWWPACVPLRARDLLRGTDGVLNGVGLIGLRGSWDRDPNHGQEAMHAFHPVLVQPLTDDEVRARMRSFAHAYRSRWRWHWSQRRSSGTCRSFQDELLTAAGLREGIEQLHTRGSGCPFLYQPRQVWWSALESAERRLQRVPTAPSARQDSARSRDDVSTAPGTTRAEHAAAGACEAVERRPPAEHEGITAGTPGRDIGSTVSADTATDASATANHVWDDTTCGSRSTGSGGSPTAVRVTAELGPAGDRTACG